MSAGEVIALVGSFVVWVGTLFWAWWWSKREFEAGYLEGWRDGRKYKGRAA